MIPTIELAPPKVSRRFGGMMTEHEHKVLVYLARSVAPKRVLEIGVNDGRTSTVLLDNVRTITEFVGVDVTPGYKCAVASQQREVPKSPGHLIKNDRRVKLIVTPQGSLDLTGFDVGMFDFILIDGDHSISAVKNDTDLAWSICNPGGMIVWHDACSWSDDITAYLTERRHFGHNIMHASDTMIAWERR